MTWTWIVIETSKPVHNDISPFLEVLWVSLTDLPLIFPRFSPSQALLAQRVLALLILDVILGRHNDLILARYDILLTFKHILRRSIPTSLSPCVYLAVCSNFSRLGWVVFRVFRCSLVNVSSRYRGIAFLLSDFVYDSDEDRTNGGNAAGDEDDPKIGTTCFS